MLIGPGVDPSPNWTWKTPVDGLGAPDGEMVILLDVW